MERQGGGGYGCLGLCRPGLQLHWRLFGFFEFSFLELWSYQRLLGLKCGSGVSTINTTLSVVLLRKKSRLRSLQLSISFGFRQKRVRSASGVRTLPGCSRAAETTGHVNGVLITGYANPFGLVETPPPCLFWSFLHLFFAVSRVNRMKLESS